MLISFTKKYAIKIITTSISVHVATIKIVATRKRIVCAKFTALSSNYTRALEAILPYNEVWFSMKIDYYARVPALFGFWLWFN